MKKNIILLFVVALMSPCIALSQAVARVPDSIAKHPGPVRIAVIRNLNNDDSTTQFMTGAVQEGHKLGFEVDTFFSNGDNARFQQLVDEAISKKYDGIILSLGRAPYASGLVKRIAAAGIKLSLFETPVDRPVSGVTFTSQDDKSLAQASLGQLISDFNGKANIVKLWVSGYPPMERRQVIYEKLLEKNPGIKELASAGSVTPDVQGDTEKEINAILAKYPKGKIDAIWSAWDAFGRGAYKALRENQRTEIKLYSIDVSNRDLQLMRETDSPWVMTVAVDQRTIGAVNMRLVANKIGGEPTPESYEFKAVSISQLQLNKAQGDVNMDSLNMIIPCWGENREFIAPWFATLEAKNAKK